MSTSIYTVEDLQLFDERCRVEAEALGLSLPPVQFHLVQAEEIYDVAARGLPGRYSHYQFGREYERAKSDYDKGRGRIYELVINTNPVHAYLLDGNGLVAQLLVIAHVYGHAAIYEHSAYFAPVDKNILPRVRGAAERIDGYIGEYGRTRVENFIDACEALEYQRSFDLLMKPTAPKEPKWEIKKFDELFPSETRERYDEFLTEREDFKGRFPKQPERDLLAFFEEHARRLEDWQRDVISIIRTEMEYFAPQMRNQVVHEATAAYYHQTIVQKLMAEDDTFSTDDFMEFQSMNARVLHPKIAYQDIWGNPVTKDTAREWIQVHCTGLNPYLTGTVIYEEIKRICENPTDEDKEQWSHWAGQMSWDDKRAEIICSYDDVALLSEFLSPRVCEKAKLFMRPRSLEEYDNLRVLKEEYEEVRDLLIEQKVNVAPYIEIVDADYHNRGELLLVHRHNGKIGLDNEYTKGTLPHLANLWGHPVVIQTLAPRIADDDEDEEELFDSGEDLDENPPPECWYRAVPGEDSVARDTKEPS